MLRRKKSKIKKDNRLPLLRGKLYHSNPEVLTKNFAIVFNITAMSKIITSIDVVEVKEYKDKVTPALIYIHSCYRTNKRAYKEQKELVDFLDKKVKFR